MASKMIPDCTLRHTNVCSNASEASPATALKIRQRRGGQGPAAEVTAALVQSAYSPSFDYVQRIHPGPTAALS